MLDGKLLEFSNQNKQHAQEIVDFTKEVDRLSEFKEIEKAFRLIEQFKVGYEFDLEKIKPQVNAIQFEHAQDIFFAAKIPGLETTRYCLEEPESFPIFLKSC